MNQDLDERKAAFEARQRAKAERARALASKHRDEAENRYSAFRSIGDRIPMGQPILVGHHSERGHRADLKRMDGHMRRMGEHLKAAEYFERRANSIESSRAILSDDPEAIEKLENKVEVLNAYIEEMKRINREFRKLKDLGEIEMSESMRRAAEHNIQIWKRAPFPAYCLANARARLLNAQKRQEQIKKAETFESFEVQTSFGNIAVTLKDARIVVSFPFKPDAETRSKLKRSPISLKWSSFAKAWVRKYTGQGEYFVQELKAALETAQGEP